MTNPGHCRMCVFGTDHADPCEFHVCSECPGRNNGRAPEKLKLVWGGLTKDDLERRNGRIFELHAMGLTNQQVGERVGLTASRVGQVIREFGP